MALPVSGPLVTVGRLQQDLGSPKIRVFEISPDPEISKGGHIPGAANPNRHTDLAGAVWRGK
jgi:thiosulfate/3-mercaptopyruvate sulfurtransferase